MEVISILQPSFLKEKVLVTIQSIGLNAKIYLKSVIYNS